MDKLTFNMGAGVPSNNIPGRLSFSIDGTTGSIYLDRDTVNNRVKFNADAKKLDHTVKINNTDFDGSGDITTEKWGKQRDLKIGDTVISVDGSDTLGYEWTHNMIGASLSSTWTGGKTAGPKLNLTVNGKTHTTDAIPSAGSDASGIVTTGAQTFSGIKTFNGGLIDESNASVYSKHFYHREYDVNRNVYQHFYDTGKTDSSVSSKANLRVWDGTNRTFKVLYFDGDGNLSWNWQNIPYIPSGNTSVGSASRPVYISGNKFYSITDLKLGDTTSNTWREIGVSRKSSSDNSYGKVYFGVNASGNYSELLFDHYNASGANDFTFQLNMSGTNLYPNADGAKDFGSLGHRWRELFGNYLNLSGAASADMSYTSTNPSIVFSEGGSQPIKLMYTDYDNYRSPAGLKVIGGTSATPAWFEVEGALYTGGLINAGGTITSASTITGNRFVVSSTSAEAHFEFSRGSWNYIKAPSGGRIAFVPNGGSISTTGAKFVIASDAVYPGENNGTMNLGTSSYKWNNVYGNNFSGNAASASSVVSSGTITMITGTAKHPSGFTVGDIYSSGYPFSYGSTWRYQGTFGAEIIFNGLGGDAGAGTGHMYFRTRSDWATSTWGDWKHLLDSSNYTTYTVTKTGSGASGTWNITSNHTNHLAIWPNSPGTATTANSPGLYIIGAGGATVGNTVDYSADTPNTHSSSAQYGTILRIKYNNTSVYYTDIYSDTNSNALLYKTVANGTSKGWLRILDSNNYKNYALPLSGGTMTGLITGKTQNTSWIGTSRNGAFRTETAASGGSANAVISMKTNTGAWGIANLTGSDNLYFVFGTDANYSAGNNTTNNYYLNTSGYFSGSCSYANSAGAVAWGNVTGKPSTFAPSSHTHNYLTAGSEGATASVRTADSSTALVTGGWATTTAGYQHQYGTTLDVSGYSSWYHRLAFNTTGYIEYWHGINTKTLTRVGYLYSTQNIIYSSTEPTAPHAGAIWLKPV